MTDTPEHEPDFTGKDPDETPVLRCNRCGKPLTPETAVLTPTGYRCHDCIRQQQKAFDNTKGIDLLLGFLISGIISFAGSWLVPRLGFLTILIAPGIGALIFKAVRAAVKQRRSKALNSAILAGTLIGNLPLLLPQMINIITMSSEMLAIIGNLTPLIWRVVYTVLVATTAFAQTKGLRL